MLKKLAAITLIAVLVFNWYGYRLLMDYWRQRADNLLENRLDRNDYDESTLLLVKVPVTSLTYYEAADEWERSDGEMILGDVAYKFVKRRVHNDSIELLCIRNTAQMQLGEAGNAFFRLVNNLTHFPGGKTTGQADIHKIFTPGRLAFRICAPPAKSIATPLFPVALLAKGFVQQLERPPVVRPSTI
jgi:hypothetical protein